MEELAERLGVSSRSVRNDLKKTEELLAAAQVPLIRDRKLGVALKKEGLTKEQRRGLFSEVDSEADYYPAEDRRRMILETFLFEAPRTTVGALMEKTKSSRTTTLKDLKDCETWLNARGILLMRRAHYGLELSYDEYRLRGAILDYASTQCRDFDFHTLYQSVKNSESMLLCLMRNDRISRYLMGINITFVRNYIRKYENDLLVRFTDESYLNIFLYICIMAHRIQDCHPLSQAHVENIRQDTEAYLWLQQNAPQMEQGLSVSISEEERRGLSVRLISAKLYTEIQNPETQQQNRRLVQRFVQIVGNRLGIDLMADPALETNLLLHINPAIQRLMYGIKIENPLKQEIFSGYQDVVKACEAGCDMLEMALGKRFDKDELSYLAMHVAASLEKITHHKNVLNLFRAVILCSSGTATSSILHAKLQREFPNIIIENILSVESLNAAALGGVDLVISTVPLYQDFQKPVLIVNPLLKKSDLLKLRNYLGRQNLSGIAPIQTDQVADDIMAILMQECLVEDYGRLYKKLSEYFLHLSDQPEPREYQLVDFLQEDQILLNAHAAGWEDGIRLAGELLHRAGHIEHRYIQSMIDQKNDIGPYIVILPGVALPHAKPSQGALHTALSFVTLDQPVEFGRQGYDPVRLIVALSAQENLDHVNALMQLTEYLESDARKQALLDCTQPEDFIALLRAFQPNTDL